MENTEVIVPIEKYDEMMKAVAKLEIIKQIFAQRGLFVSDDTVRMLLGLPSKEDSNAQ